MQQGTVSGGKFVCGVGQLADAFGAQQVHQQRRPCSIDAGHFIQINCGLSVVLTGQLLGLLFEPGVMGQRPVAADTQPRRIA